MKYTHDEKELLDTLVTVIGIIFGIIFGACVIRLAPAITKAILLAFGIETNL